MSFDIAIQKAIEVWGEEFEKQLEYSLDQEGYSDSNLKKSIRFTVTPEGENFRFQLYFDEYGNYLDEGVRGAGGVRKTTSKFNKSNNKGKMWRQKAPGSRFKFRDKKPPVRALESWSKKRGLSPFAVSYAVWKQGIEPTGWFSKVVDADYTENLIEALTEIGARQVELDFVNALKKGTVQ